MNRKQRRAAKARERSGCTTAPSFDAHIVAAHEAGHAIARYMTAAEMGYSPEEAITSIEIASPGTKPCAYTRLIDGTPFYIQATTLGPMLTKEMNQIERRMRAGLQSGETLVGRQSFDYFSKVISEARADGVDIESWLQARALFSVMGPVVEAVFREKPVDEVLHSSESEDDVRGFVRDCMIAQVPTSEFSTRIDAAVERAIELMGDSKVVAAVNALANHLFHNGTTDGKTAARIIGDAMETEAA